MRALSALRRQCSVIGGGGAPIVVKVVRHAGGLVWPAITISEDAMNDLSAQPHTESHADDVVLLSGWLEDQLGCTDIRLHKERRWRPVWRAQARQNGMETEFLLKGERTWLTHPYPLDYEMRMQRTLHENGIPIPAILGMCPDPNTIVMEWASGGRDPGLIQEAIENRSTMSPDRWKASLRYMEILADMHRIAPAKFAAAGATMPRDSTEIALGSYERFHAMTGQIGITDPLLEFCARWLRRNVPHHRASIAFLTGDCGQFLSDGPDVTAILDVEIGHLGDPMRDLACFRGRHPIENMGDVPALFLHYEQAVGAPLDYDVIAYHTVSFLAEAIYGPLFGLSETGRGGDWVESAVQVAIIGRRCMEALGEILGLEFEDLVLPDPEPTPLEDKALAKLSADIARLEESEALQGWQRGIMLSVPDFLRKRGHYRRWIEQGTLDDVAEVTGTRPVNIADADAVLARFIESAGPEQDAALTRLFHRRTLRDCLVIAGAAASPDHIALAKMEPILDRKPG
jgi:aminoglycoside phosphotransferase (APT) family kinase protein